VNQQYAYQYGVPINESLFCRLFAFFAETPKSAKNLKIYYTIYYGDNFKVKP